jgi:putative membrane protein
VSDDLTTEELGPQDPRRPLDPRDYSRRTLLANERTFLAWWRTGMAALTVGLAAGRVLPELSGAGVRWPYTVLGLGFAALGIVCIVAGQYRHMLVDAAIREGRYPEVPVTLTLVLTAGGIVLGLLLGVILLVDG